MMPVLAAIAAALVLIGLVLWWTARGAERRERARRSRRQRPAGAEAGAGAGLTYDGVAPLGSCDSGGGGDGGCGGD